MIKTIDEAVNLLNKMGWQSARWILSEFRNGQMVITQQGAFIGYNELEAIAIARSLNGDYEALEAENAKLREIIDRECPIGAFDLATTWKAEKAHMMDECASLSSKLERVREAAKDALTIGCTFDPCRCATSRIKRLLPTALAETADENVSGDNAASIGS